MKKIMILNGAGRKNGSTSALVKAFIEGAESADNEVKEFFLQNMNIRGCIGCEGCTRNGGKCVQKDDMEQITEAFLWADVVVFASPIYWGTVTGVLKTAIDRLYAVQNKLGMDSFHRQYALFMTARGNYYDLAKPQFTIFENFMHWENLGEVLGAGKTAEAKALGESIR